ncbi:MAG: hypothetical protein A2857_00840 [Candidatus Levybacteria bacterium RIFCSPHIGHO2_01_FULL_36_15]|nr:MAG: hypothetical protein A2857_00840 [Candidatus Levybacteria bacterium RIFCSPHIGHO2_01_FULL_36_15]OGH39106.1 MAG: hypothetical protein A2905_06445 [Candidatus Levybacteria bacterium RIFCSPLOWO2_01_FULL_36_10]
MPLTRSAIKKLRKDRKIEKKNESFKQELRRALKKAEKEKKSEQITQAISLTDKAVKKNIYHKNKAARLKSNLAKLTIKTEIQKEEKLPKQKKASAKKTRKK